MLYCKTNKETSGLSHNSSYLDPSVPCVWYIRGYTEVTGPAMNIGRGEFMPACLLLAVISKQSILTQEMVIFRSWSCKYYP